MYGLAYRLKDGLLKPLVWPFNAKVGEAAGAGTLRESRLTNSSASP